MKNKSKRNRIKILSATASVVLLTGAPILSISCSAAADDSMGKLWNFDSHRTVQRLTTIANGFNPFFGRGYIFAAPVEFRQAIHAEDFFNSTSLGFLQRVKVGFDDIKVSSDATNAVQKNINRDTLLKFDVSSYVKVTTSQGQTFTFDSDSGDKDDAKSINGNEFKKLLQNGSISKITLNVTPRAKASRWIKQLSGESGDFISAEDFYTSLRFRLFRDNTRVRHGNGGSKELDEFTNLTGNITTFAPLSTLTSSDFYSDAEALYGLKLSDYTNSSQKVNVVDNDEFSYNFDAKSNVDYNIFWNQIFRTVSGNYFAQPTFLIKTAQTKYDNLYKEKFGADAFAAFQQTEVYKSGVYLTYILKANEHYVGGKYYFTESTNKLLAVQQNPNYFNTEWKNQVNSKGQKTTVEKAIYKFVQIGEQNSLQSISEYRAGTSVESSFDFISDSDKVKALKFLESNNTQNEYGVYFSSAYTAGSVVNGDYDSWQLMPLMSSNKNGSIFFNNNYAKVMWNKTIPELKRGEGQDGEWSRSAFAGTGIAFRTNLFAAINAYTIMKQSYTSPIYQEYTTRFSPESRIYGKDYDLNNSKRSIDVASLTAKNYVSVDYQNKSIETSSISRSDYINAYTNPTLANTLGPYSADDLQKIKNNIKASLDQAGLGPNDQVIWENPVGRAANQVDKKINITLASLQKFVNTLDPRLKMVASVTPGKEDGTAEAKISQDEYDADFTLIAPTGSHPFVQRIYAGGEGYNISSVYTMSSYTVDSPAFPMINSIDNFQDGIIFGYSFYSDPSNSSYITNNNLQGLQPIIDTLKSAFTKVKSTFSQNSFKSASASTFHSTLNSLKFEDIWKSKPINVVDFGMAGFFGADSVTSIAKNVMLKATSALTADEKLLRDDVFTFNNFIKSLKFITTADLARKLESDMTVDETINTMKAFNIITGINVMPYSSARLGDRSRVQIALRKTWYQNGNDENNCANLAWARVDLD